jgi:hypothetical protein
MRRYLISRNLEALRSFRTRFTEPIGDMINLNWKHQYMSVRTHKEPKTEYTLSLQYFRC